MYFFRYADQVLDGNAVLISQNNEYTPIEVKEVSYSYMQGNPISNYFSLVCK